MIDNTFKDLNEWYENLNRRLAGELYGAVVRKFDEFFVGTDWSNAHYSAEISSLDEDTAGILVTFDYQHPDLILRCGLSVCKNWRGFVSSMLTTDFEKPSGSCGMRAHFRGLDEFWEEWPEYSRKALEGNYLVEVTYGKCYWSEQKEYLSNYSVTISPTSDPPDIIVDGVKHYRVASKNMEERNIDFWAEKARMGGIMAIDDYFGRTK
jgi:hypothetical protein